MAKKSNSENNSEVLETNETSTRKHELKGLLVWGSIVYTTKENSEIGLYITDEELELLVESKPELKQLCSRWNGQEV